MFQIFSQSTATDVHLLTRSFFRESAREGRPPHFVVAMLANQHFSSVAKVALSVRCPGCVKSSTEAVANHFCESGTRVSNPLPQAVSGSCATCTPAATLTQL